MLNESNVNNTVQCIATQHKTMENNRHNTTDRNTMQHNTTDHNTMQHNTTDCNTMQCNRAQQNAMQCNTTDTTQQNSPQHNKTGNKNQAHVVNKPVKVTSSLTKKSMGKNMQKKKLQEYTLLLIRSEQESPLIHNFIYTR